MKLLPLVLAVAALGTASPGAAETGPREGQGVTLKLPTVFLSRGRSGLLEDRPTYIVDLVQEAGRVSPWGGSALGETPGYDGLEVEADLPRRGTAEREEEATTSDHRSGGVACDDPKPATRDRRKRRTHPSDAPRGS